MRALIGRRKDTSLIGYGDGSKVRYKQLDKALKLDRKPVDVTIPYYDSKKEVWCLGAGEDRREDVYLDRLLQDFAGYKPWHYA